MDEDEFNILADDYRRLTNARYRPSVIGTLLRILTLTGIALAWPAAWVWLLGLAHG